MKRIIHIYLNSYQGLTQPAWMLALVMFINRVGAMVVPFLGIYMTESLHFSLRDTGIVLSFFGLGSLAGSWLGGKLTDTKGHFKVQLVSLFLTVPLFFLLPELKTTLSLSVGVFVLSLIAERFRTVNYVSIAYYAKPKNLTRAISLNRMAINLGFSIGPALGGLLAALSYNYLFYGNGITAMAAGLVFYFYFRRKKGHKIEKQERATQDGKRSTSPITKQMPTRSPYRDGPFILFNILCALYCICFFQILSTLPLYYKEFFLLKDSGVGLILAFNGLVVFTLEMLLVQFAERKMNAMQIIILGSFLTIISFLTLHISGGVWVAYLAMFFLSISEILAMPFMATISLRRASKESQGAYIGLNGLAFSAAHIFSPYLGTQIAANFGFGNLWLATALLATITTLGFFLLKKYSSI
jgi:predicted MFS family arabinose efflux permease